MYNSATLLSFENISEMLITTLRGLFP